MKYLLFKYAYPPENNVNLGDYIQTIAVREALKQINCNEKDFNFYDRDALSYYSGEECVCVMNGWFSHTLTWMPSSKLRAVYFGTHLNDKMTKYISANEEVKSLLSNYVVGARDIHTKKFLFEQGINSFYSGCLTLTLPRRISNPARHKVFIVDVSDKYYSFIPEKIKKSSVRIFQRSVGLHSGDRLHQDHYYKQADDLLKTYRDEASLVITSALHCACPCLALGIPVVFLWPHAHQNAECQRISLVGDFLPIYSMKSLRSGLVDWSPNALDMESIKSQMLSRLNEMIQDSVSDDAPLRRPIPVSGGDDIIRYTNQQIFSEKLNEKILKTTFGISKDLFRLLLNRDRHKKNDN